MTWNALGPRVRGAALGCVALAYAFILWTNFAGTSADHLLEVQPPPPADTTIAVQRASASTAYAKLAVALNIYARQRAAPNSDVVLFDSRWPEMFAKTPDHVADGEPPAPAFLSGPASGHQVAPRAASSAPQRRSPLIRTASLSDGARPGHAVSDTPTRTPTLFEKLFGKPFPLALAYAAPDDAGLGDEQSSLTLGRYDRWTAVYDISAHTVYMPDGTTLEAHSGLGTRLDDPRYVDEKKRGATPPSVYDLELREGLFHGVRALRLIPVDNDKVFGRTGLLAHSYMLGPNGNSNGCVSFKNYHAFLQAYMSHAVKRLAVVTHLN